MDDVDDRGRDATDEEVWCVGGGVGEGDPKSLLVEENSREGRRRLLVNYNFVKSGILRRNINPTYCFAPLQNVLFHPGYQATNHKLSCKFRSLLDIPLHQTKGVRVIEVGR